MSKATELADDLHAKHNGEGLLAYCEAELRRLDRVNAELREALASIYDRRSAETMAKARAALTSGDTL